MCIIKYIRSIVRIIHSLIIKGGQTYVPLTRCLSNLFNGFQRVDYSLSFSVRTLGFDRLRSPVQTTVMMENRGGILLNRKDLKGDGGEVYHGLCGSLYIFRRSCVRV